MPDPHCNECDDTHEILDVEQYPIGEQDAERVHLAPCPICPRCASPTCQKYVSDMPTPYWAVVGSRSVYCCSDSECLSAWVSGDGPFFPKPDDEAEFVFLATMQIFRRYVRVGKRPDDEARDSFYDEDLSGLVVRAGQRFNDAATYHCDEWQRNRLENQSGDHVRPRGVK